MVQYRSNNASDFMHVSCLVGFAPLHHAFPCLHPPPQHPDSFFHLCFPICERAATALSKPFTILGATSGGIAYSAYSKHLLPSSCNVYKSLPWLLVDKVPITELLSLLLGWSGGSVDQMVPRSRLNALGEDI